MLKTYRRACIAAGTHVFGQNMHTPVYITSHSSHVSCQLLLRHYQSANNSKKGLKPTVANGTLSVHASCTHAVLPIFAHAIGPPLGPGAAHGHRLSGTCPGWPASCTWRWPSCRRCLSWPTKRQKWLWCRQKLAPAVCHPGLRRCAGQRGCGPEFAAVGMVAAHQNEEMPRQGAN